MARRPKPTPGDDFDEAGWDEFVREMRRPVDAALSMRTLAASLLDADRLFEIQVGCRELTMLYDEMNAELAALTAATKGLTQ